MQPSFFVESTSCSPALALCVCTYRRPTLLARLLSDVLDQSLHLDRVIVVDGDPSSGEVVAALESHPITRRIDTSYVPSNHANLAYQRYQGWRVAQGCRVLLYLDDDLRIPGRDHLRRLLSPLFAETADAVATTAAIVFPDRSESEPQRQLNELRRSSRGRGLSRSRLARRGRPSALPLDCGPG